MDPGPDRNADLHERIDALCDRARRGGDAEVLAQMDAVLSEGYARALLEEQRVVELDERIVELVVGGGPRPARQLRAVACERRAAARSVERLRAHLADMHQRYLALGA